MYDGKKILAVIPARGGSKGLPGKNLKLLKGKPLIWWSHEAARLSKYVDRCVLSTDSEEIAAVGGENGLDVPFLRPAELARDDTPSNCVIEHAIKSMPERYDYVVVLQPTSPLRSEIDIDSGIELCMKSAVTTCVSVSMVEKTPAWYFHMGENFKLEPYSNVELPLRRQDCDQLFALNGAVYVVKVDWFLEKLTFISNDTVGLLMPQDRSVDIDSEFDLNFADFLINRERQSAARN